MGAKNRIYVSYKKSCVFKETDNGYIHSHSNNKGKLFIPQIPEFAVVLDLQGAEEIEDDGKHHQENIYRLAPCIEYEAHDQQDKVFKLPGY